MKLKEILDREYPVFWAVGILHLVGGVGLLCVLICVLGGVLGGWLARYASPPPIDPTPVPTAVPTVAPTPTPWPTVVPEPEPTSTIPPTPIGGPVPPGEAAEANRMTMVVEGATRPADEIVARANDFNPVPEPGEEYIFVELAITCHREEDDVCLYSPLINFDLIGAGVAYTPQIFLMDVPGLLEGGEIPGGGDVSGALAFVIDQGETDLTLMYQNLLGTERVFLAVPVP